MEVFADTDGKAILLGKVAQMMATGPDDVDSGSSQVLQVGGFALQTVAAARGRR
jgi:hypothetical protein